MIQGRSELRIGDLADATGIPDVQDGFLTLSIRPRCGIQEFATR